MLSLRIGEDFSVGESHFTLVAISSELEFTLVRSDDKKSFVIRSGRSYEIAPHVRASVGARSQFQLARLALEAPRSIAIVRGALSRRGQPVVVSPQALSDGIRLGLTTEDLQNLVANSAPYSHEYGNRRFDNYILDVEDGTLYGVTLFGPAIDTKRPKG